MLKIIVRMSEKGRKADILGGGTGAEVLTLSVSRDSPHFPMFLELSELTKEGPTLNMNTWQYKEITWDHVPTQEDVLIVETERRAKVLADSQAKADRLKEDTLAILREKKVRQASDYFQVEGLGSVSYSKSMPDWPYNSPKEMRESEEAIAWLAELEIVNALAREKATLVAQQKAVEEQAQREKALAVKEARAAVEAQRREALGLKEGEIDLHIEDGALTRVPSGMWSSHSRGKNWLAIITVSPSSPGGLARVWAAKAHGESYYMVPAWGVGDAVEFAADDYSARGRKDANRWYGYVVRIEPSYVVLHKCGTGKAAVKAGELLASSQLR